MSNGWIGARRVRFQEIDRDGRPVGEPTYGVIACDEHTGDYADLWRSLEDLNAALAAEGILGLLEADFDCPKDHPCFRDNYDGLKPTWDEDA